MVPYIHQTIVNPSVLLSPLSTYIIAEAGVSIKTKTIINFSVLLPQLNAYVVEETNMSAKTIKTVTQEVKQRPPHLPPPLNVWPNAKPPMLQYTATQVKKRKRPFPPLPHNDCVVIFSFLLSQPEVYLVMGASVTVPRATPIA